MGSSYRKIEYQSLQEIMNFEAQTTDDLLAKLCSDPTGSNIRFTYVLDQYAERICSNDYKKASDKLFGPDQQLDGLSPVQALQDDSGLLRIRHRINEMEWGALHKNLGRFLAVCSDANERNFKFMIALLPGAWGLTPEEFSQLLGLADASFLDDLNSEPDEEVYKRVERLKRLLCAFCAVLRPPEFPAAWRVIWEDHSQIGERSLWRAFQEDGDVALDKFELYLWLIADLRSAQRAFG